MIIFLKYLILVKIRINSVVSFELKFELIIIATIDNNKENRKIMVSFQRLMSHVCIP